MQTINKTIALLGSTGSIGMQTLDVCRDHGIGVEVLTANRDVETIEAQIREFKPKVAVMADENAAKALAVKVADTETKVYAGSDAILDAVGNMQGDTVVNAIIGGAGLAPTLAALDAGKQLALANKESLVIAGEEVMKRARKMGVSVLPIDSEHCAIFQCLMAGRKNEVSKLILTASGGPFFGRSREGLMQVTVAEALNHPTWKMGRKITVDSATLANKAFEMIEAAWLFDLPADKIDTVIHRESVVHSLVEYVDGAMIAQMSKPDMRMCIRYALSYPERMEARERTNLAQIGKLTFFEPDRETFKPLALASYVMEKGGLLASVFHGANDEAVALFLEEKIKFYQIADLTEQVVHTYRNVPSPDLEALLEANREAGARVRELAL